MPSACRSGPRTRWSRVGPVCTLGHRMRSVSCKASRSLSLSTHCLNVTLRNGQLSYEILEASKDIPYNILTCHKISKMITSKLTTKAQTTIPQPVRAALNLETGDELAYTIEDDRVILTKAGGRGSEDPFRTFSEWNSAADRKAYGNL